MKKHIKKMGSGRLAHAAVMLIALTIATGCASHRTIMSESKQHDTIISICHDTVTLIRQVMVHDTVNEQAFLTFVTDTTGRIIREREVVHHYESHHHDDSMASQSTLRDTLRTHTDQKQHSVIEVRHLRGRTQLIIILLVGCSLLVAFIARK